MLDDSLITEGREFKYSMRIGNRNGISSILIGNGAVPGSLLNDGDSHGRKSVLIGHLTRDGMLLGKGGETRKQQHHNQNFSHTFDY